MKAIAKFVLGAALLTHLPLTAGQLSQVIDKDYQNHLGALWTHLHQNPELSLMEHKTAKRLAKELREVGYKVTEGIGGTGIVGILKNGPGPMVMVRADMDGLPVVERSGRPDESKAKMKDWDGNMVGVMHACGHDVHMASMIGTARYMAANRDKWSGTVMMIGQPAEERGPGASAMMADGIWDKFGKPDYAFALHVSSGYEAGKVIVDEFSPYAGVDTVDITVHGIGAHGAHPHAGKDPVVIASQLVLNLQTIVSREIAPRDSAVITVGAIHGGTKHNIIGEKVHLQLTVRSLNEEVRQQLLSAIKRVAKGTALTAGMPEDKLPTVTIDEEFAYPPTFNDQALAQRLKGVLAKNMGEDILLPPANKGMGAEDFGFFTADPYIPSVYFKVGGTPRADFDREKAGGPAVPSHHSPLFKISPEPSVKAGVEATVLALLDLMPKK